MKRKLLLSCRRRLALQGALLGIALLASASAGAQNFVKNPDFEQPLGPDNWTVVYTNVPVSDGGVNAPTNCGPNDFLVAGRTTMAHLNLDVRDGKAGARTNSCMEGGHFAPNHSGMMHAYFKQTVSGLMPGAPYRVSAWMAQYTSNVKYLTRCKVYLEAVGGPKGTLSKVTPNVVGNCRNNLAGWQNYAVTNTASASGEIEVRLHFSKFGPTPYWEWRNLNAFYDHVALTPIAQAQ